MKLLLALLMCSFAFADTYKNNNNIIEISIQNPMPITSIPPIGNGYRSIPLLGHNLDVDTAAVEDLWEAGGTLVYLTAAEVMDLVSTDAKDTDYAVGILTLAANIADTKTVTIGTKVYTFQDTLTDVDGNVHIGTLATNTIDNLIAAITLGGTAGTDYALLMTEHPNVTAAVGAGDTMGATSEIGNNEAATTETDDNASWGAVTLVNGVGLRTVRVDGVDDDYNAISEVVSLNGTTDATTTLTFLRINRLVGQRVGSEDDNAGVITATASTVQCAMGVGDGISHDFYFTVPVNKRAYISHIEFEALSTAASTILKFELRYREINTTWIALLEKTIDIGTDHNTSTNVPFMIPSKADIKMHVQTTVNNAEVFAAANLVLINK